MSLVSAMSRTEMLGDRCQVVRGRVGAAAVLGQGAKSGFYLLPGPGPGLAWSLELCSVSEQILI